MGLFDGTALERPVLCERCGADVKTCTCPPATEAEIDVAPQKQRLIVKLEKRKRGKLVTVIAGLQLSNAKTAKLLTQLKSELGTGGTSPEAEIIELQGDQVARTRVILEKLGFRLRA